MAREAMPGSRAKLSGRVHKQCRAPPLERPGPRDLVNQLNARESGIAGLPRNPT
jgi:hypothetical protein